MVIKAGAFMVESKNFTLLILRKGRHELCQRAESRLCGLFFVIAAQENLLMLNLDARRDAARHPVLHALNAAGSGVVAQQAGHYGRSA